jgi:hypothetical protein
MLPVGCMQSLHDSTLVSISKLEEAFGGQEDMVSVVVKVERESI